MNYRVFFLVATIFHAEQTLAEDVTDAFIKCAITKRDKQRLACYDRIRDQLVAQNTPGKSQGSRYSEINLADLKTDIRQLKGKKVETVGKVQVMGGLEMVMLKTDEFDMAPVMVSAEGLPREDRKKMLNGCQIVLCTARISGTVKKGPMGDQLVAEKVSWQ